MLGYLALFLIVFAFALSYPCVGGKRYDIWWYAARIELAACFTVLLLGFLHEGYALFSAEKSRGEERKGLLARLYESEERYHGIFDMAATGIATMDLPTFRIRSANLALQQMLGYSEEELAELTIQDITYPGDMESDLPEVKAVLEGGRIAFASTRGLNPQGWRGGLGTSTGSLVYGSDGRPLYGIGLVQDITERKQAEEALRASEEKFHGLFNWMGGAIQLCELIFDEHGRPVDNRIIDVNPAYEKHTGITREQVVGRRIREILPVVEQIWLDRYAEVVRSREPAHFEEDNAGVGRWFDVHASPMEGNHFAAVFTDITERKQAEEALRASEERLGPRRRSRI